MGWTRLDSSETGRRETCGVGIQALKHLHSRQGLPHAAVGVYTVAMSTKNGSQIRNAMLGLAVCDALGAPLEFKSRRRNPEHYLRQMVPNDNFGLPAGHFTDDTSMALCLAYSLAENNGANNAVDQAARYVAWVNHGYMSSLPGQVFDVGVQTSQVLRLWRDTPGAGTINVVRERYSKEKNCGNGSLMRVLPCALVAESEQHAADLGHESSMVTHPHPRCADTCALYCALVFLASRGSSKQEVIDCLQRRLPHLDSGLRERFSRYTTLESFAAGVRDQISSSGYVVDSLEAALWSFFTTSSFEDGAVEVVNLGDDADTVGAIYGGLAGAFYGESDHCIPQVWLREMKEIDLVNQVVARLIDLVEKAN